MSAMKDVWARIEAAVEADRQKIGGMTLGASMRLGLEELRQATALEGSVSEKVQTPYGMYGTRTPGEVAEARDHDEEKLRSPAEEKVRTPDQSQGAEQ